MRANTFISLMRKFITFCHFSFKVFWGILFLFVFLNTVSMHSPGCRGFLFLFVFLNTVSMHGPGCPGTSSTDQVGLEFTKILLPLSSSFQFFVCSLKQSLLLYVLSSPQICNLPAPTSQMLKRRGGTSILIPLNCFYKHIGGNYSRKNIRDCQAHSI